MLVQDKTTSALVSIVNTIGSGADVMVMLQNIPEIRIVNVNPQEESLKGVSVEVTGSRRIGFALNGCLHVIDLNFMQFLDKVFITDCDYIRAFSSGYGLNDCEYYHCCSLSNEYYGRFSAYNVKERKEVPTVPNRITADSMTLTNSKYSSELNLNWITSVLNSDTGKYELLSRSSLIILFDERIVTSEV